MTEIKRRQISEGDIDRVIPGSIKVAPSPAEHPSVMAQCADGKGCKFCGTTKEPLIPRKLMDEDGNIEVYNLCSSCQKTRINPPEEQTAALGKEILEPHAFEPTKFMPTKCKHCGYSKDHSKHYIYDGDSTALELYQGAEESPSKGRMKCEHGEYIWNCPSCYKKKYGKELMDQSQTADLPKNHCQYCGRKLPTGKDECGERTVCREHREMLGWAQTASQEEGVCPKSPTKHHELHKEETSQASGFTEGLPKSKMVGGQAQVAQEKCGYYSAHGLHDWKLVGQEDDKRKFKCMQCGKEKIEGPMALKEQAQDTEQQHQPLAQEGINLAKKMFGKKLSELSREETKLLDDELEKKYGYRTERAQTAGSEMFKGKCARCGERATLSSRTAGGMLCEKCLKEPQTAQTDLTPVIKKAFAWLKENVTGKGLIAVNPMTAQGLAREFPELGATYDERMHYAKQIVDKYNQERRSEGAQTADKCLSCGKEGQLDSGYVCPSCAPEEGYRKAEKRRKELGLPEREP